MTKRINLHLLVLATFLITSCTAGTKKIELEPENNLLQKTFSQLRDLSKAGDVEIILNDGIYYLDKEISIKPEDLNGNKLSIRAKSEGKAIISGAVRMELNWTQAENGIWKTKVPAEGIDIDELYINGKYYRMARFPNYNKDARFYGGTSGEAISPEKVKTWENPVGGYMHSLHRGLWGSKHYEIIEARRNGKLQFRGGWQENRAGGWDEEFRGGFHKDHLFVENIAEELDFPGEWFLDKTTATLYVYVISDEKLKNAVVEGAKQIQLISITGNEENPIKDVSIEGLTFKHTKRIFMEPYERLLRGDWSISRTAAVLIEGAENINISNCYFENLGGNAVFVNNYVNNVSVTDNYFAELGESAICFVGDVKAVRTPAISYENTLDQDKIDLIPGPLTNNYPRNCIAKGNLITKIGRVGKQVAGVFISQSEEITASYNTIYNIPRAAICINDGCWGGHIIEFNDAFNTVRESGDHGPFNSWGRDRFWKTKHNGRAFQETSKETKERALLDCYKTVHIRNNRFSHSVDGHSWGIDLDDGSSNYHVYNNLCLGMGIKLREGFFRRVENNICVNGFGGFHVWFPGCDDVIKNNIWVDNMPYQFIRANPEFTSEIDFNLFFNPLGAIQFIGVEDPKDFKEWQNSGFDKNSVFADPQFVDPENGDFSVEENSPALKLGFKNFEMGTWGVSKQAFKEIVSTVERDYNYSYDYMRGFERGVENMRNVGKFKWNGAILKNLAGEAEKSAAGLTSETGVIILESSLEETYKKAGIQRGTVILGINGEKVHHIDDLIRLNRKYKGQEVELTLSSGTIMKKKLKLNISEIIKI